MARPELSTAIANWQQRSAFYNSLGVDPSKYSQIASYDLKNVLSTGASPMSTVEVNAAMLSQVAGRSLIANPNPQHHRGIFGDIIHTISSVPSDIGGLVTGLPAGMINFAHHLPSELSGTVQLLEHANNASWMTAHGYEPTTQGSLFHQAAASFRDIAKSPILDLIPGMADIAGLTSEAGRQYLMSHPVTATLDVAPAGKLTGLATRTLTTGAEEGSTLAALRAGQPLRAGVRATQSAAQRAIQDTRFQGGRLDLLTRPATLHHVINTLGYGHDVRTMVLQPFSEIGRLASKKVLDAMKPLYDEIAAGKVNEERLFQITEEAATDRPISPENEHLVMAVRRVDQTIREFRQEMYKKSGGRYGAMVVPFGKGRLTLDAGTESERAYREYNKATQRLSGARRSVNVAKRKYDKIMADASKTSEDKVRAASMFQRAMVKFENARKEQADRLGDFHDSLHAAKTGELGGTKEMSRLMRVKLRENMRSYKIKEFDDALADPNHPLYDPRPIEARLKNGWENLQRDLAIINHSSDIGLIQQAMIADAERVSPEAVEIGENLFEQLRMDTVRSVLTLIRKGLDPVWLKNIDPGAEKRLTMHRASPLPDQLSRSETLHKAVTDFSPGVMNVALGLTSAAVEAYSEEATHLFLDEHILPVSRAAVDLQLENIKLAGQEFNQARRRPTWGVTEHAKALMDQSWTAIKPEDYGLKTWPGGRYESDVRYIPKWMAHNLKGLMPEEYGISRLPFRGIYDKTLHVFRFSTLTGIRHLVHVGVAGLFAAMFRDPFLPLQFANAYRFIEDYKKGNRPGAGWLEKQWLARVGVKNLYGATTDAVAAKSIGMTHGSILSKFWHATGANIQRRMAMFEEFLSDMLRVSAGLSAEKKGMTVEEASAVVNKMAVNMDDLTPLERQIVKNVFPFYGFMKFMFRYMLTFPVDHPYRVAVFSRFADQERRDWNTLLPQKFMMTLFLGHPDAHGNIKSIDLRNLNPFRSFSNDWTLQGFFQSLNPLMTTPLTARGFNVLDATGSLYPNLEFNPQTGTLQAAPPSGSSQWYMAAEQFIPELGALDHFVGITDQMKRLKATNAAAYRATLYSQLNLPGIASPPVTVNLPYVQEREEMDRYKVAEQALSRYTEGKASADSLREFSYVPYQGKYYTPDQFISFWENLKKQYPGVDPRAIIPPPPRRATSQNPLELLSQQ